MQGPLETCDWASRSLRQHLFHGSGHSTHLLLLLLMLTLKLRAKWSKDQLLSTYSAMYACAPVTVLACRKGSRVLVCLQHHVALQY